jgi:hypothetical protein
VDPVPDPYPCNLFCQKLKVAIKRSCEKQSELKEQNVVYFGVANQAYNN